MAQVVAFLPKLNQDLPLPLWALNLGACAAICFGAFCCQDTVMMSADNFQRLWERYEESGTGAQVRAAIREGFDEIGPYDTKEQKARLLQIVLGNKDLGGESSTPE
ncbi:hypothetical protein BOTBODRAFT_257715 [Botryobasidium botryosum FD-172 SS1]|uniref:Uncharacterized protein n=1 Tax=Botryobasidium botryosum (strain FD-172 SS1) TaxID=930990 RepID=A0A067MWH1_BOTB1|nr:hypothetical protein BOTBODRAFT_257715 [Botryobasidium botryosum FD-172 SS1]